ncbi:sensor histidine kinase [Paenibacillus albiflavus]|uniref:histidine kinase n=1 Tax=Paenibacillus albiflavus TaxID=2545760 RepID=A0A4R4E1G0_9BACL|nr:sensor histidine kinase [Paenibacillus albiflavus]TCZ73189.1 sensor histidine kinase [Paenibacillus albiflavus]
MYYNKTTDQINLRVGEISQKNVSQAADHLTLVMKGYDSVSKSIIGNLDIQRMLTQVESNTSVQAISQRSIENVLGSIYYSRDDLVGIYMLTNEGKIYSYGSFTHAIDSEYSNKDWYKEIKKSKGEMVWLGMQQESIIDLMHQSPVFTFGRVLYDIYSNKPIGIVVIETEPAVVLNVLSNLNLGSHGESYILTRDNRILAYSGFPANKELKAVDLPPMSEDELTYMNNDAGFLTVVEKQPILDWRIVSVTPNSDLNVELDKNERFLFIVSGLLVLLSIGLSVFFSRMIAAPIKKMVRGMKQVERGQFDVLLEVKSFDEVNFLVSAFNRMVSRINQLIERVRFVSTSEKNAQLHALQSQVNPHFLYNTLDMIYWMLDEKENEKLGNIILSLSRMFRYSSDWEYAEITLREEMEQIRHYLAILQARADEGLHVEIDVPDACLQTELPKMTLQPIIENAIVHGLMLQEVQGRLWIHTEMDEHALTIHIRDNGVGIPCEKLGKLQDIVLKSTEEYIANESFSQEQSEEIGIGILNVHRRIVIKFGPDYGLQIRSEENKGTVVSIRLPITNQMVQQFKLKGVS